MDQQGGMGMQMVGQMVGDGWNYLMDEAKNGQQRRQQRKLSAMALEYANKQTDYNASKQMQMWRDTNFAAQRDEMEKAGLNVGLMYKNGGQGGVTGQMNGTASKGQATKSTQSNGGQLGIEGMLAQAQIENLKADAAKKRAEEQKIQGVDTAVGEATVESLTQGIENSKAQKAMTEAETYLKEIEGEVKGATLDEQIENIEWGVEMAMNQAKIAAYQEKVDKVTMDSKIQMIRARGIGAILENALTKAKTTQTDQLTEESKAKVKNMAEQISLGWEGMDQNQQRIEIQKFVEELKAEYPGLFNVAGKTINEILMGTQAVIESTTGIRPGRNHRRMK